MTEKSKMYHFKTSKKIDKLGCHQKSVQQKQSWNKFKSLEEILFWIVECTSHRIRNGTKGNQSNRLKSWKCLVISLSIISIK